MRSPPSGPVSVGVVSTRATPAFQPAEGSAASSDPRPSMTTHALKQASLLTIHDHLRAPCL